jgi:hypothetical protein
MSQMQGHFSNVGLTPLIWLRKLRRFQLLLSPAP